MQQSKTTDAFVVCPIHGDLYWDENASGDDILDVLRLEPLRNDIQRPKGSDEPKCQLCGTYVYFSVRPKVRVI